MVSYSIMALRMVKMEIHKRYFCKTILSDEGVTLDSVFHFNEKGQIIRFTAKRYKEDALENWTGQYSKDRDANGMQIPYIEVIWNLVSGDFSYAKVKIDTIEYDNTFLFD